LRFDNNKALIIPRAIKHNLTQKNLQPSSTYPRARPSLFKFF
jgi:hypothetical protein